MIHSKEATALIESFEGRRNTAYPDPATGGDPWTIGIGHTGPEVHKGLVWTDEQVDAALDSDLRRFDILTTRLVDGAEAGTTQNEFDALVSFSFNLGSKALAFSTLLKKHRAGDKSGAAAEFARWNRAGGKPMAGLTRRRAAEASLYLGK